MLHTLCSLLVNMHLAGFPYRTLSGNSKTRPGYLLPDYEIKENKVEFRGYRFSTKVEKGKNKVLKKNVVPVNWMFGAIGVIGDYSRIHFIAGQQSTIQQIVHSGYREHPIPNYRS